MSEEKGKEKISESGVSGVEVTKNGNEGEMKA